MSLQGFENQYWETRDQATVFRHKGALDLIENGSVLDLGCGDGFFLDILKNRGITGKGLDLSDVAIKKAKAKGLDAEQFDFSETALPFTDNSFDTVLLLDLLEYLYDPLFVLKEACRVAKKDVIIGVPNFSSFPVRLQVVLGKVPENNKPKHASAFWVSYPVLLDLIEQSGLKIEKVRVVSFFSKKPILKNIMQKLAQIRPSVFAVNIVVKTRKC